MISEVRPLLDLGLLHYLYLIYLVSITIDANLVFKFKLSEAATLFLNKTLRLIRFKTAQKETKVLCVQLKASYTHCNKVY